MDPTVSTAPDDSLPQTSLLSGLSIRQRLGLCAAAAAVIAGICWNVSGRPAADMVPLPYDGPLGAERIRELRAQFDEAGLKTYHQQGTALLVPRSQLAQYSTLLSSSRPANDWAAEWEQQNERLTLFSNSRALETNREIARAKLIAGMLRQLPDVEQADIVWDEDEQNGWRQSAKARATVYLRPKPDRVLTLDVVRAVRLAVAGSKKHLAPDDVVVMDLAQQMTYDGPLPRTVGDDVLPHLYSLAELYRRAIREQIHELNQADVAVGIDLPRFLAHFTSQGGRPSDVVPNARLAELAPRLMRVSATIPLDSSRSDADSNNLQRSIQHQIGQVIGMDWTGWQDQVTVSLDRSGPTQTMSARATSQAGLLSPLIGTPRFSQVIGGLISFVVLSLLAQFFVRRSLSRKAQLRSVPIPEFHTALTNARPRSGTEQFANFEEMLQLDTHFIRRAYHRTPPKCWATALRGVPAQTGKRFAAALATESAGELRREIELLGPVKIGDIQSAQQRILDTLDASHASPV